MCDEVVCGVLLCGVLFVDELKVLDIVKDFKIGMIDDLKLGEFGVVLGS